MNSLDQHEKYLKKCVFTKSKWPHFNLLFEDINILKKKIRNILCLERGGFMDHKYFQTIFY